eukprot:TRINITY_DN584_c0_g3_i4.p1 TRINITY_DN584_c0_g3~~TRINITY_DN584_c0_g3_i4.p1  ORF type:complete len:143 (-),score=42.88 TRINITY_DN584_c0_g3_i4:361-789(-)
MCIRDRVSTQSTWGKLKIKIKKKLKKRKIIFKQKQKFFHYTNKMAEQQQPQQPQQPSQAVQQPEYINLKVKAQDGEEVFFKIKKTTQFKKLMEAYCQRQSVTLQSVRFIFDGDRILETNTPNDMGMENGDEIDVVVEQQGGY